MNAIYYLPPPFLDERRREELYQGQLLVCSLQKSTPAFVEFARKLVGETFPLILRQLNDIFPWSWCARPSCEAKAKFHSSFPIKCDHARHLNEMGRDPEGTYLMFIRCGALPAIMI